MGYQFCQDEKNIEDLKDLAQNGITDLFEYGQDFMLGNALGDGKPKNDTETPEEKSFQQKYREELKKDIDFEGEDDDDTGVGEDDEPVVEEVVYDDNEEFVSSKDSLSIEIIQAKHTNHTNLNKDHKTNLLGKRTLPVLPDVGTNFINDLNHYK